MFQHLIVLKRLNYNERWKNYFLVRWIMNDNVFVKSKDIVKITNLRKGVIWQQNFPS